MTITALFLSMTLWRAHAQAVMAGRCLRRTGPFVAGRSCTELRTTVSDREYTVDLSDFGARAAVACALALGAEGPGREAFARGLAADGHLRTVPEFFGLDGSHHHGSVGVRSAGAERMLLHASDLHSDQWHGELTLIDGHLTFPRYRVVGLNAQMRDHLALIARYLEPEYDKIRFDFFAFGKLDPSGAEFVVDALTIVVGTRGLTMITGEVAAIRNGYAITSATGRQLRLLEGPAIPLPLGTLTALPRDLRPRVETVIGFMSDIATLDVFTKP